MRDGKALQMGTSHELGQNFSRAFDITYLDETGPKSYVWQTSWGVSTRLIGRSGHGARRRRRPASASPSGPVQVVVVLARADDGAECRRRHLPTSCEPPGCASSSTPAPTPRSAAGSVDWELKGVPVRVEVGPRDLAEGKVVVARRDTGTKTPVSLSGVTAAVTEALDAIHGALFDEAAELRRRRTVDAADLTEAQEAAATGFAVLPCRPSGPTERPP